MDNEHGTARALLQAWYDSTQAGIEQDHIGHSADEWYRLEDAIAQALKQAAQPNNWVACVSCLRPVHVTALNAVRCDTCGRLNAAELYAQARAPVREAEAGQE